MVLKLRIKEDDVVPIVQPEFDRAFQHHKISFLNGEFTIVYGIVSNGRSWEFGVLTRSQFTQDPGSYPLQD